MIIDININLTQTAQLKKESLFVLHASTIFSERKQDALDARRSVIFMPADSREAKKAKTRARRIRKSRRSSGQ